jgi:hypothetical protein
MSRRSPSPATPAEWPFHLRQIIQAAERECPSGHARALRELTMLALTKVPARGIFDPTSRGEHEMFTAIEAVAGRHLGLTGARAAWQSALRGAVIELEARDEIERAALQVQAVSDTAYFYAGLAFGLACMSVHRAG